MSEQPKKIGRPSVKSPEIAKEFCRRIAAGRSVKSVCSDEDMPSDYTIWRWLYEDEDFSSLYTRAIQARAISHAERIDELAEMVTRGEIPPDVGRVAIDAKKWTASRLLPRLYGDKQQVEATVTHTHTLHLEALKELANKARGNEIGYKQTQVIDLVATPTFHGEMSPSNPVLIGDASDVNSSHVNGSDMNSLDINRVDPPGSPLPPGAGAGAAPPLSKNKKTRRKKDA